MKNIGIAALAAVAALVLGFGAQLGTQTAHADVTDTVAIGCEFLVGAIDGDTTDAVVLPGDFTAACDGITFAEASLLAGGTTETGLGDDDNVLEASDFADIDLDANQLIDGGANSTNTTVIFAFVNDVQTVTFDVPTTFTVAVNDDGLIAAGASDSNPETCAAAENLDEDCNPASLTTDRDGVVVATVTEAGARGQSGTVTMSQADNPAATSDQVLAITGIPYNVSAVAAETSIVSSGTSAAATTCVNASDSSDATQLSDLDKTFVAATVTDADGTEMTRAMVIFTTDSATVSQIDTDAGETGADPKGQTGISVDGGDSGIAAFGVVCGGAGTGTATITATLSPDFVAGGTDDRTATAEVQVVGEPASVALTASPAAIDCDGTASSTVTATVTDADGNNVVDGTSVNFSVVALGIANPINADTTDGAASSTVTALSGALAGVTVIVTAGDAQASIRVDCNPEAAPTAGPGVSPTPGTGVTPPDTGNGGYLGQDSSAGFPMWTLVALTLGAVALAAGGMVTKNVTR